MRIQKDGETFFVPLDFGIQSTQPRVSFATDSHGQMVEPALHLTEDALHRLCAELLPHIQGAKLLPSGWHNQWRAQRLRELIRIFREVCEAFKVDPPGSYIWSLLPADDQRAIEVLLKAPQSAEVVPQADLQPGTQ